MSAIFGESAKAKNQTSPSNWVCWVAIGRDTSCPSVETVVSIAMRTSLMSSWTFALPSSVSVEPSLPEYVEESVMQAGYPVVPRTHAGSERHRLGPPSHFGAPVLPQRVDRSARQRLVLGEQPGDDLPVVVAAVVEHGQHPGDTLDNEAAVEERSRDLLP